MILRKLYYSVGPKTRRIVRRLFYLPGDLIDALRRKRFVPAKGSNYTGAGDFIAIGDKFVDLARRETKVATSAKVLDIGSGLGRIARPLAGYLDNQGSYYGFDVVPEGINWCRKQYREFKNFHFQFIPLKNDLYNRKLTLNASEFVFPYDDNVFDLAFSVSVFTHMQVDGVNRYLNEAARVLKEGQYMIATFFIIYDTWNEHEKSSFRTMFPFRFDGFYLHHSTVKDANVAFDLNTLTKLVENAGFRIASNFPGWWNNEKSKNERFDYQDVLIFEKVR